MKKVFAIALIAASFAACNGSGEKKEGGDTAAKAPVVDTTTKAPAVDTTKKAPVDTTKKAAADTTKK